MYEDSFKGYDQNIKGKQVSILPDKSLNLGQFRLGRGVSFPKQTFVGILTGYFNQEADGSYFVQIKLNKIIEGFSYGYANTTSLYKFESGTHLQAQSELNQLLGFHKSILEKNLLCARGLELVAETGAAVPVELKQRLYNLQAKLINRNNALKTSGYVENIEEGEHPKLSAYNQALVTFMNNPGIGFVISGTAIIIILAVVAAASAAIAYAVFKKMNAEAKADYAFSNDLTAQLLKYLPKDVYDKLMKENAANQAAAQDAIDNAKGGGIFTALKTGGLILLGVYLADKFIFNQQNQYHESRR